MFSKLTNQNFNINYVEPPDFLHGYTHIESLCGQDLVLGTTEFGMTNGRKSNVIVADFDSIATRSNIQFNLPAKSSLTALKVIGPNLVSVRCEMFLFNNVSIYFSLRKH